MFLDQVHKGANHWWRYLLAIVSLIMAYGVGQIPIYVLFYTQKQKLGLSDAAFQAAAETLNYAALGIPDLLFFSLMMPPFIVSMVVLLWVYPKLFRRPILSFLTTRPSLDWRRLLFGGALWFTLSCLFLFLFLPSEDYVSTFQPMRFLLLLALALCLLPIQVAAEEIIFRGMIFQGLYKLTRNRWVAFGLVTLAFALVHSSNPEMRSGIWRVMPAYVMMSALFGFVTLRDGGLELAIGLHLGNNLLAALIMSTSDGALTTPALFKTSVSDLVAVLPPLLVVLSALSLVIIWWRYWRPQKQQAK